MITKAKMLNYLIIVGVLMSAVPCAVAAMNEIGTEDHIRVLDKEALKDVLDSVAANGDNIVSYSLDGPIHDEFLTYANFGSDNSCYTPGQGVGGYENRLYVVTGQYCYVYEVSIPEGADPNMHPDSADPEEQGPMALRTLTFIESHDIGTDMGGSTYQSQSAFYVDDTGIYYGPAPGGIHKWDHSWNYQGNVVDVSLYSESLAYDADNDVWYAGMADRQIYSFRPRIDTSWQYEFTYPTYEGSHHDGLEYENGFLWISDMTTNWVGQWKKESDGTWNEVVRFNYDNPIDDDVEGMGYGPLGHLWATGWSRLYEIGGKGLGDVLEGITLSMTLDKDEYNQGDVMQISALVIDKKSNIPYPIVDKVQVKIDGDGVDIEDIIVQPDDTIMIKVRTPSGGGDHTVWVQVETDLGSASDSESFTVSGEAPTGTVRVDDKAGTVDEATEKWDYPTKYNAPVFRRGVDNPMFTLTLNSQLTVDYEALFEVYSPNDASIPIGSVKSSCCGADGKSLIGTWQWTDTNGNPLSRDQIPVGIYRVNGSLVNVDDQSDKRDLECSDEFYVIFDFEQDRALFITRDLDDSYIAGGGSKCIGQELHQYDKRFWKRALSSASGSKTIQEAADKIAHLSRNITGKTTYHHLGSNETTCFGANGIDDDFDPSTDDATENWANDYNGTGGRATIAHSNDRELIGSHISQYGDIVDITEAAQVKYYHDAIDFITSDFRPYKLNGEEKLQNWREHPVGVCQDYSMLSTAYLRGIGIPAKELAGWDDGGHSWLWYFNSSKDNWNSEWFHLDSDGWPTYSGWNNKKFKKQGYFENGNDILQNVFVQDQNNKKTNVWYLYRPTVDIQPISYNRNTNVINLKISMDKKHKGFENWDVVLHSLHYQDALLRQPPISLQPENVVLSPDGFKSVDITSTTQIGIDDIIAVRASWSDLPLKTKMGTKIFIPSILPAPTTQSSALQTSQITESVEKKILVNNSEFELDMQSVSDFEFDNNSLELVWNIDGKAMVKEVINYTGNYTVYEIMNPSNDSQEYKLLIPIPKEGDGTVTVPSEGNTSYVTRYDENNITTMALVPKWDVESATDSLVWISKSVTLEQGNSFALISYTHTQPNTVTPTEAYNHLCEMLESSNMPLVYYSIKSVDELKSNKTSQMTVEIENPTDSQRTVNLTVDLMSADLSTGGTPTSVGYSSKQVTIPPNSAIISSMDMTVPSFVYPGNYTLMLYDYTDSPLTVVKPVEVVSNYNISISKPEEVTIGVPFNFDVPIKNNDTEPIRNLTTKLNLHHYFNTTEPLAKDISQLDPDETHTFTWNLTPTDYGELGLDVEVYSDSGCEMKSVDIHALKTPKLSITPTVPEKVEKCDNFVLTTTVFNSGDLPSDAVGLTITPPPNVTANTTSVDIGVIGAHENKSWTFSITQDESEDFVILLNATSTNTTTENYAFINIVQPNIFLDILEGDENAGVEQHTDVIETLADEPCSVTVYIRNTGDEKLNNVQILTNMSVNEDVGGINEGEILQVPLEFTPTTPGFNELNVTVKSDEIEKTITRMLLVEKFNFVVSVPKVEYNQGESVPINISVMNEVPDIRFIDLKVVINISNPTYNQTFDIPLLSLAPFVRKNITSVWDTTGVNNSTYTLVTSLMMANREVVSEEQYIYLGVTMPSVIIDIADVTAQSSHTATVPITINGMANFGAATVTISYDPAVVHITSVTAGDVGTPIANIDNTAGTATIVTYVSTATGPDSPITLANLELSAVGSSGDTSPLTLAITTLADADGTPVSATVGSGVFVVCAGAKGDLNGDDRITSADATIALQMAVRGEYADAADVSGDDRVTSLDALMILQAAAGGITL